MYDLYNDPLADIFGSPYGTPTPAVYRPLPRPVSALVQPAPVPQDDDDLEASDPPMQEEPEHIRSWFATLDDIPCDPANDDALAPAEPAVVPVSDKAARPHKPLKLARPTKPQKTDSHPKHAFRFALMADPMLKPASKVVGIYLADLIDVETGTAYPSRDDVMKATGYEVGAVKRAFRDLRGSWFQSVQRHGRDRNQWAPIYIHPKGERWELKHVQAGKGKPMTPQWCPAGIDDADEGEDGGCDCTPKGAADDPLGGRTWTPKGAADGPPILHEHTSNTTKNTSVENEAKPSPSNCTRTQFDKDWSKFQSVWPGSLDDTWRPAFMAARRDGWSLAQLTDTISHIIANMPDKCEFVSAARFFGRCMWEDCNEWPEHHQHQYAKHPASAFEFELDEASPF